MGFTWNRTYYVSVGVSDSVPRRPQSKRIQLVFIRSARTNEQNENSRTQEKYYSARSEQRTVTRIPLAVPGLENLTVSPRNSGISIRGHDGNSTIARYVRVHTRVNKKNNLKKTWQNHCWTRLERRPPRSWKNRLRENTENTASEKYRPSNSGPARRVPLVNFANPATKKTIILNGNSIGHFRRKEPEVSDFRAESHVERNPNIGF